MIYVDYPTYDFNVKKGKPISFSLAGDERLTCRMLVVKMDGTLPAITIKGSKGELKGKKNQGRPHRIYGSRKRGINDHLETKVNVAGTKHNSQAKLT